MALRCEDLAALPLQANISQGHIAPKLEKQRLEKGVKMVEADFATALKVELALNCRIILSRNLRHVA